MLVNVQCIAGELGLKELVGLLRRVVLLPARLGQGRLHGDAIDCELRLTLNGCAFLIEYQVPIGTLQCLSYSL